MEIVIGLIALAVLGYGFYVYRSKGTLDINNDGKVDLADAKAVAEQAVADVKSVADVNNDGKVDANDAKAAATKAKTAVKKTASKAKAAVKKTATKKGRPAKAK